MLTLALETVAAFALTRHRFHHFEERARGVGKIGVLAVDQAQFSFQLQLANRDAHQFSTLISGRNATPLPRATNCLIACNVGSSRSMCSGVLWVLNSCRTLSR